MPPLKRGPQRGHPTRFFPQIKCLTPSPVHTNAEIAYLIGALTELWAACPVGKGEYVRLAAA
jgi:hypothetical protein